MMQIYADIEIIGTTVKAIMDTGDSSFGHISQENAQTFQLKTERLEQPVVLTEMEGDVERHFVARDLSVKGFGTQEKGECFLEPYETLPIIGMPFICGSIITFFR